MESIILTGAAGGIGRAMVRHMLEAGFRIHACDVSRDGLTRLEQKHRGLPLITHCLDISDATAFGDWVTQILREDQDARALVNNAGIYLGKDLAQYTLEEIERVIQVNFHAAVIGCRAFGMAFGERNGTGAIVNISSVAAQAGSSDPVYGATKAGLLGLTKSCALQFAPRIRVNAVAPGIVETPMLEHMPSARLKHYREAELLERPLQPDDVAAAVLFLLSDKASGVTGTVLDLNNGCYLR